MTRKGSSSRAQGVGFGVSSLGSDCQFCLVSTGGAVLMLWSREGSGACQFLCSWRVLSVKTNSLGCAPR